MKGCTLRLKCLSARFVIDIKAWTKRVSPTDSCLKCLSARFVIDMDEAYVSGNAIVADEVSNAFRLDS